MKKINAHTLNQIAIFLILFACYVYTFPRWADWNQNSRFCLVQAVVDNATLTIDNCTLNTGDYARFEGHNYSDKAPGLSFAAMPAYAIYRAIFSLPPLESLLEKVGNSSALASTLNEDGTGVNLDKLHGAVGMIFSTVLIVSLVSALLGVVMYRFLLGFTDKPIYSIIVVLTYGLTTIAFPYAGAFYAHQLIAALLFITFAMAAWFNPQNSTPWRLGLMGFMLGYAVIGEYPVAIIAIAVFLYLLYKLPRKLLIGWTIIGGIIPGVMAASLNFAIFRTPMPVAYYYSELWKDVHGIGTFQWEAFWGITGSTYRGLFFMSPILLIALVGMLYMWQERRFWAEALVTTFVVVSFILFNSSLKTWAGGFSVGPRYLVPMVPFLAWPLIFVLNRHGAVWWGRFIYGGATLLSWLFVWTLTLGGQRFPEDLPREIWNFPLRDYSLPLLLEGNIARNAGLVLGLRGSASLLPLIALLLLIGVAWWGLSRSRWVQSPKN